MPIHISQRRMSHVHTVMNRHFGSASCSIFSMDSKEMATADIDLNFIDQSLAHVNNFSRRRQAEKLQPVLMYEIPCDGEGCYKTLTLRELFSYVNNEASDIDEEFLSKKLQSESRSPTSSRFSNDPSAIAINPTGAEKSDGINVVSELRLRDLRRLDYAFNPNEEKSILIRKHAILFAMDPIRAVVMASRLILIVPDGADSLISILDRYMKEWNTVDDMKVDHSTSSHLLSSSSPSYTPPFESHAYEALITTVKALEEQEYSRLEKAVQGTLVFFRSGSLIPVAVQEEMRSLKNDLSLLTTRLSSCHKALHALTDDDEDMALMNLTFLRNKPNLYRCPLQQEILARHDEIEELLESYLIDFNSLESKVNYLRSTIQSAEELVSLRLDTSRNELLIANTALAVLACSIGFGGYISGIFGMNLDNVNTIQPVKNVFIIVFVGSFVTILLLFVGILYYLRKSGMLPKGSSFRIKGKGGRMGRLV